MRCLICDLFIEKFFFKYVTPGPGEYLVPSGLAVSKPGQVVPGSAHKLARTSSFRLKKVGMFSNSYISISRDNVLKMFI